MVIHCLCYTKSNFAPSKAIHADFHVILALLFSAVWIVLPCLSLLALDLASDSCIVICSVSKLVELI